MPEILLVDNHSIFLSGLKLIIKTFFPGYQTDEAADNISALGKIKHKNFALIIMDISLPCDDSSCLVKNILSIKPESKIIIFSLNPEKIYKNKYLKKGAMKYLRKDGTLEEISKTIGSVLKTK